MADYLNALGNGIGKPPGGIDAFDAAEAAPEFSPLPPGVYVCRVVKGEFCSTRAGCDAYRVRFAVTEGEHSGRTCVRVWTFSERAIAYSKRDLSGFGLTTSAALLSPFPPAGRECFCRLVVALQRGDDGVERNDVKRIDQIRFVETPASRFMLPEQGRRGGE